MMMPDDHPLDGEPRKDSSMERKLSSIIKSYSFVPNKRRKEVWVLFIERLPGCNSTVHSEWLSLSALDGYLAAKSPDFDPDRKWIEKSISRTIIALVDPRIE